MDNVKNYFLSRLQDINNKLDILLHTNQCTEDFIFSEYIKLKNELVKDVKSLYNDDNIKFDIKYELSKNNSSSLTCKALNTFTFYLLQGYSYSVVKNMVITNEDITDNAKKIYNDTIENNFRKHEL